MNDFKSTTTPAEPGLKLGTKYNSGKIDRTSAMLELAVSFPSLRVHLMGLHPGNWSIDRFMADLDVLSSGERCAKLFIASVWDSSWPAAHGVDFNAVDAIGIWDAEHRWAFLKWCADPFWP